MATFTVRPEGIIRQPALTMPGNATGSEAACTALNASSIRTLLSLGTADSPSFSGLTLTGNLLFNATNTYDIGNGTLDPRTVRAATSVLTPQVTISGSNGGILTSASPFGLDGVTVRNSTNTAYGVFGASGVAMLYNGTSNASGGCLDANITAYRVLFNRLDAGHIQTISTGVLGWGAAATNLLSQNPDTGIGRVSSATAEVNNGMLVSGGGTLGTLNVATVDRPTAALTLGNSTYGVTVPGNAVIGDGASANSLTLNASLYRQILLKSAGVARGYISADATNSFAVTNSLGSITQLAINGSTSFATFAGGASFAGSGSFDGFSTTSAGVSITGGALQAPCVINTTLYPQIALNYNGVLCGYIEGNTTNCFVVKTTSGGVQPSPLVINNSTGAATFSGDISCAAITASGVVTLPNNLGSGSLVFSGSTSRLRSSGNSVYLESETSIAIGCTAISDVLTFATANNTTPFARIIGYANNGKAQLALYTKSGQTVAPLLLGDSTITTLAGLSASTGILEINNGTVVASGGSYVDLKCAGITASGAIQETYRTSSLDPSISDIGSGKRQGWYNTTALEFRDWVNVGGTLLKSAAYT